MRARDLSIRMKLLLLVGLFAVGFAAFITVVSLAMKPKLEDSDYNDVVMMKDVLADVLPPPKYVIEPYLVLLQLDHQEDAAAREALIGSWRELERTFDERQRYWSQVLPDSKLKQALQVDSTATARELFALGNEEVIPAARARDHQRMHALLGGPVQEVYRRHRAAIDQVVMAVNRQSAVNVDEAAGAISSRKRKLALLGVFVIAGCAVFGAMVARSLAHRIRDAVVALNAIASGDFGRQVEDDSTDDLGVMANALNEMTVNLGRLVRDVGSATDLEPKLARPSASSPAGASGGDATSTMKDLAENIGAMVVSAATPARRGGGGGEGGNESFYEHLGGKVSTLIQNALAFEAQRQRAESLTELDRVKTAFFSNVSHELRTPLTLILGPVEDAIASPSKSLQGNHLDTVHRNALRLLKLVNTLLELSRVEAGRTQARFEATDLAMLTAGLASSFRTLVESAGLRLTIDCPRLDEPVYVDSAHWENIVLNLISNAFKFTFEGAIEVSLRARDGHVELRIADTGTGISPEQLPRIFERFHRVEGARGRSYEGTGIGLALVHDLAKQHGGAVRAESVVDQGSTFVVTIPLGTAHLPPAQIAPMSPEVTLTKAPLPYVMEAARWGATSLVAGPDVDVEATRTLAGPMLGPRVLLADDNADMREYLVRVLSTRWAVEAVEDGDIALAVAIHHPPDIILSDVLMPRMNGVALLQALRANPRTRTLPFILLSARAAEESIIGGLETGADDYLVKPFSTRELMSRVHAHLEMARIRRVATDAATELAETRAALLADLERKNEELEAFSYSVSHDLRAPLRSIDYFARLVLDEHGAALEPPVRDHLGRVLNAAQRMAALINDLLELSRVDRSALRPEPVDLSRIARRIAETLQTANPDRHVELVVPEHIVAQADPRLAEILLENILGNAWKFTKKTLEPRVELGMLETDGRRTFYVKDNGAGFDVAYASRLFAPFQRLHSELEFSGSGIGLATVKRIVTRHGGTAWADGQVGRGATIYWTLPSSSR